MSIVTFIRFESCEVDAVTKTEIGVFSLVSRLHRRRRLDSSEERSRRELYDWFDAACVDPATVDAHVYDRTMNPMTKAWFKQATTSHLVEQLQPLLVILDRHGVAWQRCVCEQSPGRLIYTDHFEVVVEPPARLHLALTSVGGS